MTVAKAAQLEPAAAGAGEAAAGRGDVGVFLGAVATMMRQTVERFEDTVGRISELVMTRSARPDRELVVALQDFDRLQQEFVALGDTLVRFAAASDEAASVRGDEFGNVISAIAVGDLRHRLLCRLEGKDPDFGVSIVSDEGTFDEEVF
jgi:hypothetical protein